MAHNRAVLLTYPGQTVPVHYEVKNVLPVRSTPIFQMHALHTSLALMFM